MITIIAPTTQKNGLFAVKDELNANIYNIQKRNLNGRYIGLVIRYNLSTNNFQMDGTTWRRYIAYDINLNELHQLVSDTITKGQ
jgi:hypothetical protein